jgi:hypothetical protein
MFLAQQQWWASQQLLLLLWRACLLKGSDVRKDTSCLLKSFTINLNVVFTAAKTQMQKMMKHFDTSQADVRRRRNIQRISTQRHKASKHNIHHLQFML